MTAVGFEPTMQNALDLKANSLTNSDTLPQFLFESSNMFFPKKELPRQDLNLGLRFHQKSGILPLDHGVKKSPIPRIELGS